MPVDEAEVCELDQPVWDVTGYGGSAHDLTYDEAFKQAQALDKQTGYKHCVVSSRTRREKGSSKSNGSDKS